MRVVYKSKLGLEIIIPISLVLGSTLYIMLVQRSWLNVLGIGLVILFICYLFLNTIYIIKENLLIVKSGFLYRRTIEIASITTIKETNNPLSSPAISLDRLEIRYGRFGSVLISPKNKHVFIAQLKSLNPEIIVQLR